MRHRIMVVAVTLLWLAVAALPLVLTLALGWYRTDLLRSPLGPDSDIYVLLPVFYAVWLPLSTVGLVFLYDRLGVHYMYSERQPLPEKQTKRRREAAMGYLRNREKARQGSQKASDDDRDRAG
jgi:hypothetical protein